MVYEHKLRSTIKTVPVSAVTVPTGHALDKHGIVFVGDRAGIAFDKISDTEVSVNFDTTTDFSTTLFDEAALPKVGETIYVATADGKLTKTATNNKLVGFYWGKSGGSVIFSLGM